MITTGTAAVSTRTRLARFDEDMAMLERARALWGQAERCVAADPREAFELVHRAALRGAGVLVVRANRERKRKLPLNVWTALGRVDAAGALRAAEMAPLVAERARLERLPEALPDPLLLRRHLELTRVHLEEVAEVLLGDLPAPMAALAG